MGGLICSDKYYTPKDTVGGAKIIVSGAEATFVFVQYGYVPSFAIIDPYHNKGKVIYQGDEVVFFNKDANDGILIYREGQNLILEVKGVDRTAYVRFMFPRI